ncbi:anthrone oxygenase family protein [Arenibaculum pallidiluteum]|uniref:anthrone oxygenase family protein n=1 Tax=Arenibaculum pallidiluteum TaxID=2812559 RepID=UPI001A978763|nr:anthrone oxygenase family protein [Arenibaculum pallidiluteum]
MPWLLVTALLWFCAIGCGLLGGLYFAFSAFIMTALGRIESGHGMAAMNAINTAILHSSFLPLFYGTTLAGLVLAATAAFTWDEAGAPAMLAGGLIHALGMFAVTIAFNVPLNNALASGDPAGAGPLWQRYLREWTAWNHVRTVSCTVACALFILAIALSTP